MAYKGFQTWKGGFLLNIYIPTTLFEKSIIKYFPNKVVDCDITFASLVELEGCWSIYIIYVHIFIIYVYVYIYLLYRCKCFNRN